MLNTLLAFSIIVCRSRQIPNHIFNISNINVTNTTTSHDLRDLRDVKIQITGAGNLPINLIGGLMV